ncbi:hypothetical protein RHGRI_033025 [Rhododendron griersonianum]|uniref:Myb/SANT-like domain-containing protein n=1 Tax=Rhododendron griersonianum TaxID=479676 RepID=A0AAV6HYW9_9ERIC|nr:hypothetical protein RHGRI_033025 [Rhododendron griersonianum]
MAIATTLSYATSIASIMSAFPYFNYVDRPIYLTKTERGKVRQELMNWLRQGDKCRDVTRMGLHAFEMLVYIIRESFRLNDTWIAWAHVRVKVSHKDVPRFRGRKDYPSQNVLAASSFNCKFTYVLPGWERSTSDSRIINNALTREDKLSVPLDDKILAEVDEEPANAEPEETSSDHFITNECEEGVNLRANIAAQMWNDYVLNEVSAMEVLSNKKGGPKKNLIWTQEMDDYLVDVLYEQALYGNKIDRSFTATACANASKAMSQKFGENILKEHIKNRLKTIIQNFNLAYDLVKNTSGLGWNEETRMLEADPDVWKELLAANPNAKKFHMRPLPKFDQLVAIYGKDRATGACAETAKEKKRRWEKERSERSLDYIDEFLTQNEVQFENLDDSLRSTSKKIHLDSTPSSKGTKRKGAMVDLLLEQFQVFNNGSMKLLLHLEKEIWFSMKETWH